MYGVSGAFMVRANYGVTVQPCRVAARSEKGRWSETQT